VSVGVGVSVIVGIGIGVGYWMDGEALIESAEWKNITDRSIVAASSGSDCFAAGTASEGYTVIVCDWMKALNERTDWIKALKLALNEKELYWMDREALIHALCVEQKEREQASMLANFQWVDGCHFSDALDSAPRQWVPG